MNLDTEDDIINRENKYHKQPREIDLRRNIKENVGLLFVILVPIIGMYYMFRKKTRGCLLDKNRSNAMFNILVVSLLMTTFEVMFVYWYNIQNVHNDIQEKIGNRLGFHEYLFMKDVNNDIPNVLHSEFKKSYERNLQSITFILMLPILLICIFMLSSLTGCVSVGYKDVLGIIVNVLLLIVVFSITFVNLGMKQSAPVDYGKIADTFDPYEDVHRFQKYYDIVSDKQVVGIFGGLMAGILAFIAIVYSIK
jgi:cytochrome bd-type quinol oxidase subunit 2